ncbi:MAG: biotin synthase BioB [Planctomycetota bacterium]
MKPAFSHAIEAGSPMTREQMRQVLEPGTVDLVDLVQDASRLRLRHFGRKVRVHILNNVQNGLCEEDCGYCGQAKNSDAAVKGYAMKKDEEILAEAAKAKAEGSYRYCMVMSGRGPSDKAVDRMADVIRKIKGELGLKTCLSAGLMSPQQTAKLKEAGLDRLNHNLNTAKSRYSEICSTHTWEQRQDTLRNARQAGIELCSGFIFGMGESLEERLDMAEQCKELAPESVPVNFLLPIEGNRVSAPQDLSPETCVRILCLLRYVNPTAEIRMAAGREHHVRGLQSLALWVANSLFADGYLLSRGQESDATMSLIRDAGFEPEGLPASLTPPTSNSSYVELKPAVARAT